jgi:hypothetical protein
MGDKARRSTAERFLASLPARNDAATSPAGLLEATPSRFWRAVRGF